MGPEGYGDHGLYLETRASLIRWLDAGLDRGFLAECRAWTVTLSLYREGLSLGLWNPIDWLEAILAKRQPGEALSTLVIRVLSPDFTDPTEGVFASPLISSALQAERTRLLSPNYVLEMGNLADFVIERRAN